MVSHRKYVPTQTLLRPDVAKSASGRIFIPLVAQFERQEKEQKSIWLRICFLKPDAFIISYPGLITGEPGTSR